MLLVGCSVDATVHSAALVHVATECVVADSPLISIADEYRDFG